MHKNFDKFLQAIVSWFGGFPHCVYIVTQWSKLFWRHTCVYLAKDSYTEFVIFYHQTTLRICTCTVNCTCNCNSHTLYILLFIACIYILAGSLDAMKDLVAETAVMKTFDHPNVLPLLGVCVDADDEEVLKIVLPFMANADLKTFLKSNRVSPSNTCEFSKVI